MIWIVIGFLAALLAFYKFLISPQLYWRRKNVQQGPPVPILGDNWKFFFRLESVTDLMISAYKRFPHTRYCGMYQTVMRALVVRDPELIKQITIKDFDHFTDHRNFVPDQIDPIWTRHLFALKGEEWRKMRTTLSPTFTSSKMRAMFTLMNESGQQFVTHFLKRNQSIIEVDAKDAFTRFANDVIATCAFGITCDSLENPQNDFYVNGKTITDMGGFWKGIKFVISFVAPKFATFFKLGIFPEYAGKYFQAIVMDAIKYREAHNIVRPDMINLLMEARKGKLKYEEDAHNTKSSGFATAEEHLTDANIHNSEMKNMTDLDMAAQVLIFFFAGFETVSTLMAFLAYEMALNPECQATLNDEIDTTIKRTNGKLTYEDLFSMKYLDMVVSEALRKHFPNIGTDRVCTKPYVIEPKYPDESPVNLEVGDGVWFATIGMHLDPKYFPDPERFDPERFSDENKDKIKPYTYMPFGVGPRNCIGSRFALMEIKILFFHLLSKFEIVVIDRTTIPFKLAMGAIVPKLEGGYWVGFKKREIV